jgi:peptide/nickel transport system substrate-binding protein
MMAVDQEDYMAAVTAGDKTGYSACKSFFPCGTRYGVEIGGQAMQGNIEKAREILKASGYKGEKAVLLNPIDLVTVGPLGDVTYDIMKRIGINVEMVATDWGTVVQRRVSREPVEKNGWSALHTWGPSTIRFTPVEHSQIRGLGPTAWFGWYKDDEIEAITRSFLEATTEEDRAKFARAAQARAFDQVPSVPLGTFQIRTAIRKSLTGMIEATGPYPWNIKRV